MGRSASRNLAIELYRDAAVDFSWTRRSLPWDLDLSMSDCWSGLESQKNSISGGMLKGFEAASPVLAMAGAKDVTGSAALPVKLAWQSQGQLT
mmetsp:Transcript_84958/g.127345  ORF Transcript_84958/g.127345 Transcript_84958/m.127345 type:complete len:93 (-) Transcript_84958:2-280(-)